MKILLSSIVLKKLYKVYKMKGKEISDWLREYLLNAKLSSLIVGVSGGIDSAVVSTLAAQTTKPTYVVSMPIHQEETQLKRANNHIEWLQQKYPNVIPMEIDLTRTYNKLIDTLTPSPHPSQSKWKHPTEIANANTRARLRMTTLYNLSATYGGLVVGTGNKIEDFGVGFFTKYGDGGVDISPIADLYKSEVYTLGKELGVSDEIIGAAPTDGLWADGRTDEEQLGATYEELEWAMKWFEIGDETTTVSEREKEILSIYLRHYMINKHKMIPIPIYQND